MKTFATKSNAKRALKSIGDVAFAKAEELIQEIDGKFGFSIEAAELVQYEAVTGQTYNEATTELEPMVTFPVENLNEFFVVRGQEHCPECGSTELYRGRAPKGLVVDEDFVSGCHHCNWEVDSRKLVKVETAEKSAKTSVAQINKSEIENPCKRVWHIADEMLVTHPGAKRKQVLEACQAAGIAFYTARTQYQQWLSVRKEMAEREAQQGSKK